MPLPFRILAFEAIKYTRDAEAIEIVTEFLRRPEKARIPPAFGILAPVWPEA